MNICLEAASKLAVTYSRPSSCSPLRHSKKPVASIPPATSRWDMNFNVHPEKSVPASSIELTIDHAPKIRFGMGVMSDDGASGPAGIGFKPDCILPGTRIIAGCSSTTRGCSCVLSSHGKTAVDTAATPLMIAAMTVAEERID